MSLFAGNYNGGDDGGGSIPAELDFVADYLTVISQATEAAALAAIQAEFAIANGDYVLAYIVSNINFLSKVTYTGGVGTVTEAVTPIPASVLALNNGVHYLNEAPAWNPVSSPVPAAFSFLVDYLSELNHASEVAALADMQTSFSIPDGTFNLAYTVTSTNIISSVTYTGGTGVVNSSVPVVPASAFNLENGLSYFNKIFLWENSNQIIFAVDYLSPTNYANTTLALAGMQAEFGIADGEYVLAVVVTSTNFVSRINYVGGVGIVISTLTPIRDTVLNINDGIHYLNGAPGWPPVVAAPPAINFAVDYLSITDYASQALAFSGMQTDFSIPDGTFNLAYTVSSVNIISSVIYSGGVGTLGSSLVSLPDSAFNINEGFGYLNNTSVWAKAIQPVDVDLDFVVDYFNSFSYPNQATAFIDMRVRYFIPDGTFNLAFTVANVNIISKVLYVGGTGTAVSSLPVLPRSIFNLDTGFGYVNNTSVWGEAFPLVHADYLDNTPYSSVGLALVGMRTLFSIPDNIIVHLAFIESGQTKISRAIYRLGVGDELNRINPVASSVLNVDEGLLYKNNNSSWTAVVPPSAAIFNFVVSYLTIVNQATEVAALAAIQTEFSIPDGDFVLAYIVNNVNFISKVTYTGGVGTVTEIVSPIPDSVFNINLGLAYLNVVPAWTPAITPAEVSIDSLVDYLSITDYATEALAFSGMQTDFSIPDGTFNLAYTQASVNIISSVTYSGGVGTRDSSLISLPDSAFNINEGFGYVNNTSVWDKAIQPLPADLDFVVDYLSTEDYATAILAFADMQTKFSIPDGTHTLGYTQAALNIISEVTYASGVGTLDSSLASLPESVFNINSGIAYLNNTTVWNDSIKVYASNYLDITNFSTEALALSGMQAIYGIPNGDFVLAYTVSNFSFLSKVNYTGGIGTVIEAIIPAPIAIINIYDGLNYINQGLLWEKSIPPNSALFDYVVRYLSVVDYATEALALSGMQTDFSIPDGTHILAYTVSAANVISSVVYTGGVGVVFSSLSTLPDSAFNTNDGLAYLNNTSSWSEAVQPVPAALDFVVDYLSGLIYANDAAAIAFMQLDYAIPDGTFNLAYIVASVNIISSVTYTGGVGSLNSSLPTLPDSVFNINSGISYTNQTTFWENSNQINFAVDYLSIVDYADYNAALAGIQTEFGIADGEHLLAFTAASINFVAIINYVSAAGNTIYQITPLPESAFNINNGLAYLNNTSSWSEAVQPVPVDLDFVVDYLDGENYGSLVLALAGIQTKFTLPDGTFDLAFIVASLNVVSNVTYNGGVGTVNTSAIPLPESVYNINDGLAYLNNTTIWQQVVVQGEFSPRNLPGLTLWLDAADRSTVDVIDDDVTAWRDKSGRGAHFYQNDIAKQPEYGPLSQSEKMNGIHVLKFDTAQLISDVAINARTIVIVFEGEVGQITDAVLFGENGAVANEIRLFGALDDEFRGNAGTTSVDFTNGAGLLRIDNSAFQTFFPERAVIVLAQSDSLRHFKPLISDDDAGLSWTGNVAEIVVYDRPLSLSEQTGIYEHLALKWGRNPTKLDGLEILTSDFKLPLEELIVASTVHAQGERPLTATYNRVSTVANDLDTVTLDYPIVGGEQVIMNKGENVLQVFPPAGVDLGNGFDQPGFLGVNERVTFVGIGNSLWDFSTLTTDANGFWFADDNLIDFIIDSQNQETMYSSVSLGILSVLTGFDFNSGANGTALGLLGVDIEPGGPGILVTTDSPHGFSQLDIISLTGFIINTAYNGVYQIRSIFNATQFIVDQTFGTQELNTGFVNCGATLTVRPAAAGSVSIAYSLSAVPSSSNEEFQFRLYVNAIPMPGSRRIQRFGTGGDYNTVSGGGEADLKAGDKISFAIMNRDSTADILISDMTLNVNGR